MVTEKKVIILNVIWAEDQHIRMISERSCETDK